MLYLVAGLSGSELVLINVVAVRLARWMGLGWQSMSGYAISYVTSHLGQLSLPSLLGRLIGVRSLVPGDPIWQVMPCIALRWVHEERVTFKNR